MGVVGLRIGNLYSTSFLQFFSNNYLHDFLPYKEKSFFGFFLFFMV
jgi:hypothetical protein